jgi:hypothetical protein
LIPLDKDTGNEGIGSASGRPCCPFQPPKTKNARPGRSLAVKPWRGILDNLPRRHPCQVNRPDAELRGLRDGHPLFEQFEPTGPTTAGLVRVLLRQHRDGNSWVAPPRSGSGIWRKNSLFLRSTCRRLCSSIRAQRQNRTRLRSRRIHAPTAATAMRKSVR